MEKDRPQKTAFDKAGTKTDGLQLEDRNFFSNKQGMPLSCSARIFNVFGQFIILIRFLYLQQPLYLYAFFLFYFACFW